MTSKILKYQQYKYSWNIARFQRNTFVKYSLNITVLCGQRHLIEIIFFRILREKLFRKLRVVVKAGQSWNQKVDNVNYFDYYPRVPKYLSPSVYSTNYSVALYRANLIFHLSPLYKNILGLIYVLPCFPFHFDYCILRAALHSSQCNIALLSYKSEIYNSLWAIRPNMNETSFTVARQVF